MHILKNFIIPTKHQKPILTDLYYAKTKTPKPLVIFCHGYKGYKDWGAFDKMASLFTEHNLTLLKFNFSHNGGTPEQPIDFPDLEAFGKNNYSLELEDLQTVINWVSNASEHQHEIDTNHIILIGHSRGGGIATLTASKDSRIKQLITWAAVASLDRTMFKEGPDLTQWKETGVFYVINGRTQQHMPHYIQFYQDYMDHKERLNIENAARQLNIPQLIIHGDRDTSVPASHAHDLHRWNPKSKLCIIPEANHVFGVKQPWTAETFPPHFLATLQETFDFIKRH
jgi:pimeloyl-ACP methyl ester carboxylesterase